MVGKQTYLSSGTYLGHVITNSKSVTDKRDEGQKDYCCFNRPPKYTGCSVEQKQPFTNLETAPTGLSMETKLLTYNQLHANGSTYILTRYLNSTQVLGLNCFYQSMAANQIKDKPINNNKQIHFSFLLLSPYRCTYLHTYLCTHTKRNKILFGLENHTILSLLVITILSYQSLPITSKQSLLHYSLWMLTQNTYQMQ